MCTLGIHRCRHREGSPREGNGDHLAASARFMILGRSRFKRVPRRLRVIRGTHLPWHHDDVDRDWVAINDLVLKGLKDGYSFDEPPETDGDLRELAATITDHVIAGVVPRRKGPTPGRRDRCP